MVLGFADRVVADVLCATADKLMLSRINEKDFSLLRLFNRIEML